jgi:hypothetical protein
MLTAGWGTGHRALAADDHLITSVAVSHEYNDNLKLNANDELSDNITTLSPKLEMIHHSERYTLRADGRLDFYRYKDHDTFDDTDQWYNGKFDATPTERWQVGAEAHVSDDHRPDRDIEETGLVLKNVRRRRVDVGASASYTFSEFVTGGLNLEFDRENFDDPQTYDLKDYHSVLFLTRRLDAWLARTTGRLNLGYDRYAFGRGYIQSGTTGPFDVNTDVDDQSTVDNYSLTIGTETDLTERLRLSVDVGGRYARSQRTLRVSRTYIPPLISEVPTESDDSYDSYGFVGSTTFTYRGERYRTDLLLSYDLQPVSGNNSTANRTTVRLSGSMRLLEHLRGNLFLQWYHNENNSNDATQDTINTRNWNAGGGLLWALNDYLDLVANYVYTIYEDREAETTAYRNKAVIQLEAHYDWLE